jgi:alanyl-tRNA synthetase
MTSKEIRNQFLEFFKNKEHKIVQSAPVVPYDDPTLLFTNAGMNQFKDVFLGQGKRDYTRAADTQKCIRVSGKHNDLEEVGQDTYHHTFFEMLGNWSFGDYYKKEAITWAWELMTEVWKLPKERLWATVYRTDDEAFEIWKNETDIDDSHILRFDEKDNFWEMGETGPCGPSSEIHINLSDNLEDASLVNAGNPLCIELWNLVFIQNLRDADGTLHELPQKHIDTGMGFERVVAVLNGKSSNYDTDIFVPLLEAIANLTGKKYEGENEAPMRVIADHIRTLTFAIADGAIPGNEGRSYVLRRILRRAARFGRKLGLNEPFMYKLVDVVIDEAGGGMGEVFPEIKSNRESIKKVIRSEEESFNLTLDRGIVLFEEIVANSGDNKIISGRDVFKLYDTYGFPVDLVELMARERGFGVDIKGFDELMNEQKNRARESTKKKIAGSYDVEGIENELDLENRVETKFVGYEKLESNSEILDVAVKEKNAFILLNETPFYAESGGQVSDKGSIIVDQSNLEVLRVLKIKGRIIHVVEITAQIELRKGITVTAKVDKEHRWDVMRNHSATHFLHATLRKVLGTHVKQAGSHVSAERLRFDFTHFAKLTEEEKTEIEKRVNHAIRENIELTHHRNIPFEDAKKMGALMFFGDKYGDKVNVVQFGDYSVEFCGGTHVQNSSQLECFKIIQETSVASGVRRIEAVTGKGAELYLLQKESELKSAFDKIEALTDEKKKLEKKIAELEIQNKIGGLDEVLKTRAEVESVSIYKGEVNAASMDELKSIADELREKIKTGVGVLISPIGEKVGIVAVVSDDLIKEKKLMAGKIVGQIAKIVGGGGGGRPHLATAGGKDIAKIPEALNGVEEIIKSFLS